MGKHKKNDDTNNFLKGALAIIIIAIIAVLAYGGKIYIGDQKQVSSDENNKQQTSVSANEQKKEDKKADEPVVEEKVEEPEKEEEKEEPSAENEENQPEEVSINDEDKAIEMAKKEFGTTDGVYFRIEHIQANGVYEISVRDKETTRDIMWYTVDVKNGTVK